MADEGFDNPGKLLISVLGNGESHRGRRRKT